MFCSELLCRFLQRNSQDTNIFAKATINTANDFGHRGGHGPEMVVGPRIRALEQWAGEILKNKGGSLSTSSYWAVRTIGLPLCGHALFAKDHDVPAKNPDSYLRSVQIPHEESRVYIVLLHSAVVSDEWLVKTTCCRKSTKLLAWSNGLFALTSKLGKSQPTSSSADVGPWWQSCSGNKKRGYDLHRNPLKFWSG